MDCISALRDQAAYVPEPLSLRTKGGTASPEREVVLSEHLAGEARQDPGVLNFRQAALQNKLLPPDPQAIADWIEALKAKERGPRHSVVVQVPRGKSPREIPRFGRIIKMERPALSYPGPDGYVTHTSIAYAGVLDRLRGLCDSLARRYRWHPAEAAAFVLTDWTPIVRQISIRLDLNVISPVLNRILISVDPAVSPQELAARYRTVRREATGQVREPSAKRIRLAAFCVSRPPETYAEMMKAWNRAHPKDKYTAHSNFGRDAAIAVRAVFGIDLKGRRKK
ncbi:MAG: hypothetical protein IT159_12810 [Bryobacterales bacterium]|nr:hypothetical protein [Bryobacterales bacterium]